MREKKKKKKNGWLNNANLSRRRRRDRCERRHRGGNFFDAPSHACAVSSSRCAPLARVRIGRAAARAWNLAFGRLTFLCVCAFCCCLLLFARSSAVLSEEKYFGGKKWFRERFRVSYLKHFGRSGKRYLAPHFKETHKQIIIERDASERVVFVCACVCESLLRTKNNIRSCQKARSRPRSASAARSPSGRD